MEQPKKRLIVVAILFLLNAAAGAALAIRQNLPPAFIGLRSDRKVRDDFLWGWGTALSPPLLLFALHGLFIGLTVGSGQTRRAGVKGLLAGSVLYTVGMLGEPITYRVLRPRSFEAGKAAIVTGNIVLPLLMIAEALAARKRMAE